MAIDIKKFDRNKLANNIKALVESKRGLQTQLANSIGKSASIFSEVKRGKRVNVYHLVAIGRILGPKRVLELLEIDNIPKKEATRDEMTDEDRAWYRKRIEFLEGRILRLEEKLDGKAEGPTMGDDEVLATTIPLGRRHL